jgi:hypothetical protein
MLRSDSLTTWLGLALVVTVLPVRAEFLLLTGATYWAGALYGPVPVSQSQTFDMRTGITGLFGTLIEEGDTLAYDVQTGTWQRYPGTLPSELITQHPAFMGFDVDRDVVVFDARTRFFDRPASAADVNGTGKAVLVGSLFGSALASTGNSVVSGGGDNGSDPVDADGDEDGLTDDEEDRLGTNPEKADTDGDRLNDGDEVVFGTDPLNPDSDGDGTVDGVEVAKGRNPLKNEPVSIISILDSLLRDR